MAFITFHSLSTHDERGNSDIVKIMHYQQVFLELYNAILNKINDLTIKPNPKCELIMVIEKHQEIRKKKKKDSLPLP